MIELNQVSKSYLHREQSIVALHDISLQVQRGEIFGIIGKSGAGKSTLIRCVNLLERPDRGIVCVNNQNLMDLGKSQLREARHQIGMIFQHYNLLSCTVFDNIAFPLRLIKKSAKEIDRIVTPLLELTNMVDRKKSYPSQLSGGQKQRVAIARALATQPQVLLCDEMTSALDPATTTTILNLLRNINQQMQLSVLLITHAMSVIKTVADRVAVLDRGSIVECKNVVDLFKNPQTTIAKELVHSILQQELPHSIAKHLQNQPIENGYTIIRIHFTGRQTTQPIIDELVRQAEVRINIIQANMEFLRNESIGIMTIALQGKKEHIQQAQNFLKQHDLTIEVLGHVRANDWPFN